MALPVVGGLVSPGPVRGPSFGSRSVQMGASSGRPPWVRVALAVATVAVTSGDSAQTPPGKVRVRRPRLGSRERSSGFRLWHSQGPRVPQQPGRPLYRAEAAARASAGPQLLRGAGHTCPGSSCRSRFPAWGHGVPSLKGLGGAAAASLLHQGAGQQRGLRRVHAVAALGPGTASWDLAESTQPQTQPPLPGGQTLGLPSLARQPWDKPIARH